MKIFSEKNTEIELLRWGGLLPSEEKISKNVEFISMYLRFQPKEHYDDVNANFKKTTSEIGMILQLTEKKERELLCNFQLKKSQENVYTYKKPRKCNISLSLFFVLPEVKKIIKTRDNSKFFKYQISSSSKKVKSFLFYWDAILCVFML